MKLSQCNSFHLFLSIFLLVIVPAAVMADTGPDPLYEIVVYKHDRELQLRRGDAVVRRYITSVGRGGVGHKQRRGDKKTPIGTYSIVEVRPSDRYHTFMHLNYPNLADAAHAYRDGRLDGIEYQEFREAYALGVSPPQDTDLGGQIGIHGLGWTDRSLLRIHHLFNWTQGCVALTNRQIEQLQKFVTVGTPVTIYE